jgi:OOP family OmpA-OmpF porin
MKFIKTFAVIALAVGVLLGPAFQASAQQQKAVSFAILIDQSVAMKTTYHGDSKHRLARKCAKEFLKAVPTSIPLNGAIYMYGIAASDRANRVLRVQGMKPFNLGQFMTSMKDVGPQAGASNLGEALIQVRQDVKENSGLMALIIISDGSYDPKAEKEAKNLKSATPFKVCWYTVLIGNSQLGGKFLSDIADTSKSCHKTKVYDRIDNPPAMAKFSKQVFFKPGAGDADEDGVADNQDRCPGTPDGAEVDINGCWILGNINFDSGKTDVKPQYQYYLDGIAGVLNVNPEISVDIIGHTDSDGSDASNQTLSDGRAMAVKSYLIQSGVAPNRLNAYGMGETQPIADNSSAAGKAMNRRIEMKRR